MTETESFKRVDPFDGHSILYLDPLTFRNSTDALKCNNHKAIHELMKSMHFEKARSIGDGSSELLNMKESEANAEDKDPQERRPALARKRARFSLKPDTRQSQPSTVLEPSFQIDELQDPEEFFAAYEKLENTRKEMKRQRGDDLSEVNISLTARHRRPEIPGRKVSYKHHEYSIRSKNDTSFSQETLQDNIGSPSTHCQQQESTTPNRECQEEEVPGSMAKTEERVNKLFDELLSSDIDKLDGNEALSFLKNRLNIKSVDVGDLRLPDFHAVGGVDFISPVNNLIEDQSILCDILPDGSKGKTLGQQKKLSDNPSHPLASPMPPRSPLLAFSTFGKQMSKLIASNDPFSARDIDLFPTTSFTDIFSGHSAHVSKEESLVSGTLDLLAKNKVTKTAVADDSQKVSAEAAIYSRVSDEFLNQNMYGSSATSLSEPLIGVDGHEQCPNIEQRAVDDNVFGPYADTDSRRNEGIKGNTEDMVAKAASDAILNLNVEDIPDNVQPHCIRDTEENVEDVPEKAGATLPGVDAELSMIKNLKSHQSQSALCSSDPLLANAETGANSTEDLAASRSSQNPDIVPEQRNEEHPRTSKNKRKKTTSQADLRKRRQSLAEAGTSWTSGVRRSNRIRKRPLEYWKGERFLYGRVHNSLPTIIGVKYISSMKDDGEYGFKVESFVSDKYKELVELTALH